MAKEKITVSNQDRFRDAAASFATGAKTAAAGVIFSIVFLTAVLMLFRFSGGEVLHYAAIPFTLAALFSLAAMVYGILGKQAAGEDEAKALLANRASTRALDVEEDVRFTAGRTLQNYQRFSPYVYSLLGALIVLLYLLSFNGQSDVSGITLQRGNFTNNALIEALITAAAMFTGIFFLGQSRMESCRWLRPAGAWLCAGGTVSAAAMVISLCAVNGIMAPDSVAGNIIFWISAILGAEFITNVIIEFYRPRNARENRPVFESRLLALVTEPGGVMRNIASALDYQFGFKISGTWLYSFVERAFFPLILLFALIFWLSTAIHEVSPQETGIRETFGKAEKKQLPPGIYFSLPYPFGNIAKFSCSELQQIIIGEKDDDDHAPSTVILWTESHGGQNDNFVVAVPRDKDAPSQASSISFIRMQIPVQYRIKPEGLFDYAYNHRDAGQLLTLLGSSCAAEYLASCSMDEIMSSGRAAAENAIKKMLQQRADAAGIGVEIVSLSILDAHPPTGGEKDVAASYQDVLAALEKKETLILQAQAYAAKTAPETAASTLEAVSKAQAYAHRIKIVAAAESERFSTQMKVYRILPEMFKLKAFLEVLEKEGANLRKFIISDKLDDGVYELNFEEKSRLDLLNSGLGNLDNGK